MAIRKTERLLNLIAFFLNAREPKDLEAISKIEGYRGKSLEALRQAFYRDRRELAKFGVLISYDQEREGYFLPTEQRYLPRIDFTSEEITAMCLLRKLVEERADLPWKTELKTGLQKILLEEEPEEGVSFNVPFLVDLKTFNQQEEIIKDIELAITNCKEISFFYKPPERKSAEKWIIQPYLIFQKENVWYLVGYSTDHSDYRTFRLNRIQGKVKVLNEDKEGPDFERDPFFNQEDFFFLLPWEYGSNPPIKVVVRFSSKAAFWVEKSSSKKLKVEEDGSEILIFEVKDEDAFVRWLLGFAEDAEVLKPQSVRRKIQKALDKIEKVYCDARP